MTPNESNHYESVRSLFFRALDLDESLRPQFVQTATDYAPEVREEVLRLLGADGRAAQAAQQPAAHKPAGVAEVGGYRILGVLGRGGMGTVYHAEGPGGEEVAVKLLSGHFDAAAAEVSFRKERSALSRLNHRSIARFIDSGLTAVDGTQVPYIVMEFVSGTSLRDAMTSDELTREGKLQILIEVASALDAAHEAGVVHRDLKPENILLDDGGMPRIIDFGIARLLDATTITRMHDTVEGGMVGTLQYMSPEQLSDATDKPDRRSDVYSLGVIAFELLTGRRPYETGDLLLPEAIARVATAEPKWQRGDEVPAHLRFVLGRALTKLPAGRYQSASEFAADLRRVQEGRSPRSAWKHRLGAARRYVRYAAPLLVLAVAAVAYFSTQGGSGTSDDVALRQLCREVDVLDDRRHADRLSDAEVRALIPLFEEKLERSIEIADADVSEQLARYLSFRVGELYYFLGSREWERSHFERAADAWQYSNNITYELLVIDVMPSENLRRRMRALIPHYAIETRGLAYDALADFDTPLRFADFARQARHYAWQAYYDLPDSVRFLSMEAPGHLNNNLGKSLARIGYLSADIAAADSGLVLLRTEYDVNHMEWNYSVRAYVIHNFATALLWRHQTTGSPHDLAEAEQRAREALASRGRSASRSERAYSLGLVADCRAFAIAAGGEATSTDEALVDEVLVEADSIGKAGDVRAQVKVRLMAGRLALALAEARSDTTGLGRADRMAALAEIEAAAHGATYIAMRALAQRAKVAALRYHLTGDPQQQQLVRQWATRAGEAISRTQSVPLHRSVDHALALLDGVEAVAQPR